nr:vegetative cell wall protein gp1-like [Lolium perenne]
MTGTAAQVRALPPISTVTAALPLRLRTTPQMPYRRRHGRPTTKHIISGPFIPLVLLNSWSTRSTIWPRVRITTESIHPRTRLPPHRSAKLLPTVANQTRGSTPPPGLTAARPRLPWLRPPRLRSDSAQLPRLPGPTIRAAAPQMPRPPRAARPAAAIPAPPAASRPSPHAPRQRPHPLVSLHARCCQLDSHPPRSLPPARSQQLTTRSRASTLTHSSSSGRLPVGRPRPSRSSDSPWTRRPALPPLSRVRPNLSCST